MLNPNKKYSFRDRNSGWTNCSLVNENISTLDFDFEAELKKQKSKTGVNKLKMNAVVLLGSPTQGRVTHS